MPSAAPSWALILLVIIALCALAALLHSVRLRRRIEREHEETKVKYGLVMEALTESVYDWDVERDKVSYTHTARSGVSGNAPHEHTSKFWAERVHEDDKERHLAALVATLKGQQSHLDSTFRYKTIHGEWRWARQRGFAMHNEAQRAYRMVGTIRDVTEEIHAAEALKRSEERYQRLYDTLPDICVTASKNALLKSVNQVGASYLGYHKDELIDEPLLSIVHPEDRLQVGRTLREFFTTGLSDSAVECRLLRKDQSVLWVHQRIHLIHDTIDDLPEVRIVCRDITQSHELAQELAYRATHDPLTGLVNRRELEQRLGRALVTARERGRKHALCYLDLDQFKVINDTCGHEAGDMMLRQIADLFATQVRKTDTLARLGGDEFAILMDNCRLEAAKRVSDGIRAEVADFRFTWKDKTFAIGVSIGIVTIEGSEGTVSDAMRAADTACYVAKDRGRNRVHVFQEDDEELGRRHGEMEWVARITRAIEENRFELYFQPITRTERGAAACHEAPHSAHYELLLRMTDGAKIVLPDAFLPAAERFNLSGKLDRHVVNLAFDWFQRVPAHVAELELCSINLSAQSLSDEEFLHFLVDKLRRNGVPSRKICFEITETAAISNLAAATRFITTLRKMGCRFALDDFGSGLSSFAYLKHLDVEYLKIDGVFVKDINSDPIDFAMVRSINEIGKVMGKKTVAEFVEKEAILTALQEIGVDYVQGNIIARPAPLSSLSEHVGIPKDAARLM